MQKKWQARGGGLVLRGRHSEAGLDPLTFSFSIPGIGRSVWPLGLNYSEKSVELGRNQPAALVDRAPTTFEDEMIRLAGISYQFGDLLENGDTGLLQKLKDGRCPADPAETTPALSRPKKMG